MPKKAQADTGKKTPEQLMKMVNERYGEGTMVRGSDPRFQIERIPSGILSLDMALGGGFARGRHVEVQGPPSVGKTYVALCLIAQAQANGLDCAYVDAEGTYSEEFAAINGVDTERLFIHRQRTGNRAMDFIEILLRAGEFGVIVLDSIASLMPQQELEMDMSSATMGTQQAKLMSAGLRKLTTANEKTILFYINQQREVIGGMVFGKKMTTSGGRAMGFYASTRLEMVRTETLKTKTPWVNPSTGEITKKDLPSGHRVLTKIIKDKTGARPQTETSFVFDYATGGVDEIADLMYVGRKYGLVFKRGNTWWVQDYEDEAKTSKGGFYNWLKRNRAVADELEERLRDIAADSEMAEADAEEEEDE